MNKQMLALKPVLIGIVTSGFLLFTAVVAPGHSQGTNPLTAEQIERVHSRLFRNGPAGEIPNILSKSRGDVNIPCVVGVSQSIKVEMSITDELALLASDSDLVVLGKTQAGTTHVNADRDFLYTDWKFAVEEILKDNPSAATQTGATIIVTRPGGKLQVNGRMVYATCADFLDFAAGQEYLLYLRFVPETGAYSIRTGAAAFGISPSPRRLDPLNFHESEANNKETLLQSARDGVAVSKGSRR